MRCGAQLASPQRHLGTPQRRLGRLAPRLELKVRADPGLRDLLFWLCLQETPAGSTRLHPR